MAYLWDSLKLYLAYKVRLYTKEEYRDQRTLLGKGGSGTILDVGAHTGESAIKYSRLFPSSKVYSFEPLPESFRVLQSRFKNNPRIIPIQAAVSDSEGIQQFFSNVDSATNSLLPVTDEAAQWVDVPGSVRPNQKVEVETVTIDGFCKDRNIDRVAILKMDIQGGELLALNGATESLRKRAISLILCEMLFVPLYERQAQFYQVCDFLASFEYRLYSLYNFAYSGGGQLKWCDGLFVSPDIQKAL